MNFSFDGDGEKKKKKKQPSAVRVCGKPCKQDYCLFMQSCKQLKQTAAVPVFGVSAAVSAHESEHI